jgi:hypothetical protein
MVCLLSTTMDMPGPGISLLGEFGLAICSVRVCHLDLFADGFVGAQLSAHWS